MVAVIPMAGRGSRFSSQNYGLPKPLIPVSGKPMVLWALKSLQNIPISLVVVVLLKDHEKQFSVKKLLRDNLNVPVSFVMLDDVTEGQLSTVLAAEEFINTDEDVLISSSDTFVEGSLYQDVCSQRTDGLISVADLPGDQWSFVRTNDKGHAVEVAEKIRISDHASTGLYYFRKGKDLIRFGKQLIENNERTRGEFYVIPVYQKMIDAGLKIGISKAAAMWDMGTPEAKNEFEKYLLDN